MNILDWIIIAWLVIAFIVGVRLGLIYRIGHIIGLALGVQLALKYYSVIAAWFGSSVWNQVIIFLLIVVAVGELAGIVALLLDKIFKLFSWIPFLKSANALLGGIVAVLNHVVLISICVYFATTLSLNVIVTQTIAESQLGSWALITGAWLAKFTPGL